MCVCLWLPPYLIPGLLSGVERGPFAISAFLHDDSVIIAKFNSQVTPRNFVFRVTWIYVSGWESISFNSSSSFSCQFSSSRWAVRGTVDTFPIPYLCLKHTSPWPAIIQRLGLWRLPGYCLSFPCQCPLVTQLTEVSGNHLSPVGTVSAWCEPPSVTPKNATSFWPGLRACGTRDGYSPFPLCYGAKTLRTKFVYSFRRLVFPKEHHLISLKAGPSVQETQTSTLWQPRGVECGGKWEGGSRERGHIIPMADSCGCMMETNTILHCNNPLIKNK